MSRTFGETSAKEVFLDFWLVVDPGKPGTWPRRPSVRINAGYPALSRTERAINLKLYLPLALFEAPALSASIRVEQPSQAVVIDAEAVASAVRQVIGMDVDIAVNPQPGAPE